MLKETDRLLKETDRLLVTADAARGQRLLCCYS